MIFSLIFCLLNLLQPVGERPVTYVIRDSELDEEFNILNIMLYGTVYYFKEIEPTSAAEAYEKFFAGEFVRIPQRARFNKGFQEFDYWFATDIENMTNREHQITYDAYYGSFYRIDYYEFDAHGNLLTTDAAGYSVPGNKRKLNHRNDSFEVVLPPRSKKTLFIRANFMGGKTSSAFYSGEYQSVLRDSGWRAFLVGLISGRLYAIAVLGFLVFLFFRQKIYLFLSLYIGFGILIFLDADQSILDVLDNATYLKTGPWFAPISSLLFSTFALLFTHELFRINLKEQTLTLWIPRFGMFQLAYVGICLLLFFNFLEPKEMPIFYTISQYLGIINLVLCLAICFVYFRENRALAGFALTANLLLAFGGIVYFATSLGSTQFLPFDFGFITYGLTFNVLIIIIGLVYQFLVSQETKIRLLTEQNQIEQQMVKLTIEAQDKERQRIAKDLHDDLGSNLAMIKLRMELLMENQTKLNHSNQNLEEIHQLLDGACRDLRYISHELMPADLSTKVMRTMVEELVEKLSVQKRVAIRAQMEEIPILSIDTKVNLFRIIKELMNNVLKHSKATEASIHLFQLPDSETIILEINDNGKGMPKEVMEGKSKGMGLKNLEKRVEYLNGKLHIQSSGLGTLIRVDIPLVSNQLAYEENNTDR
ncbi:ATP-binding protein [Cognataquiflexum rubidum]|uniref:sensor histidine kinase n=1 Tax=Cognataquiflexum rubidum TaxID=2922273 RepID=UPI001F132505|nr:ATP-binding protein [Cognataquiflexum rubidum]MCH6233591.1 histidine kinase [Cognataquiflexum rubidum]